MSTSKTQRYKPSMRFLEQKAHHQGKGRDIVNVMEHESRNVDTLDETLENNRN